MTRPSPTINVPIVSFCINSAPKPDMRDTAIFIEKSKIYVGPNWKLPFTALSETTIADIQTILQDQETSDLEEEIAFILESSDHSKSFECIFPSQGGVNTNASGNLLGVNQNQFIRQRQDIFRFLNKFIKLYDKWVFKQNQKLRKEEEIQKESVSYGRGRAYNTYGNSMPTFGSPVKKSPKRQVYGKRSAVFANRTSLISGKDGGSKDRHEEFDSGSLSVKETKSKYRSKVQKLKDKILTRKINRGYYSSDEEDMRAFKRDPRPDAQEEMRAEEPVLDVDEEIDDVEKMDEEELPSVGTKRTLISKGRRLKKKVRIDEEDDEDSDFEFDTHTISATKDTFDVFPDDKNGHVKPQTTHLTKQAASKVAHITPPRSSTASQSAKQKQDLIEDLVTDDEEIEDPHTSSPLANQSKALGIQSFFTTGKPTISSLPAKSGGSSTFASSDEDEAPLIRDTVVSEPRKMLKLPKIAQQPVQACARTLADAALRVTSPNKCIEPLKLGANPRSMHTPSRPNALSVKNPYKKSISPTQTNSTMNKTKKQYSNHTGLINLGNTCYLNSSLQILFSVPGFLDDLNETYEKLNTISNDQRSLPLSFALLTVASRVRMIPPILKSDATREGPAYPSILKKQMDLLTDKFIGYEQRDAHEFLSDLIDFLHDELINAKNAKGGEIEMVLPTDNYFRLDVDVCLTCESCKYSRSKEELYRHLSVEVGANIGTGEDEQWSIDKGLQKFFQAEVRDIQCEKCEEGKSVTQTINIKSRPKALLVHLKRFVVEMDKGVVTFQKSTSCVTTTNSVSLDAFTKEKACVGEAYELRGVVRHIGKTSNSGHYTADALRKQETGEGSEWVYFDDTSSSKTSTESVLNNERNQRNNYLMLYSRE